MFRFITGKPGSGKSYYATHYLRKFCTYDKVYNSLDLNDDILLITNLDDIKVKHLSVDQFFEYQLYIIDNMREYLKQYRYKRAILIVDEAQKYFSGIRDNDLFFFFEYHRHLGCDIFLLCHSIAPFPRRLVTLAEYIVEAMPRVYKTVGFRYQNKDTETGQVIFTSLLRLDQTIFMLYKSFETDEIVKPKPIVIYKLIAGVIAFFVVIAGAFYWVSHGNLFPDQMKKRDNMITQHRQQIGKPLDVRKIYKEQNDKVEQENEDHDTADQDDTTPAFAVLDRKSVQHDIIPNGKCKGTVTTDDKVYLLFK